MTELERQLLNSLEQIQSDNAKKHQEFLRACKVLETSYNQIKTENYDLIKQVNVLLDSQQEQRRATNEKISNLTEQVSNLASQVSRLKK
jgi:archaellum component FlaC